VGVTAYVIATDTFRPLVLAQAKARKIDPKLLVVKHPVGGLNADELKERIDTAWASLSKVVG
jgi:hypothetical protein